MELSSAATRICAARSIPLLVEMELRFGCLVIKRTHFRDAPEDLPGAQIEQRLFIDFRATLANACHPSGQTSAISQPENHIANVGPYVPSWCRIGYANGQWTCDFGYDRERHAIP